MLVFFVVGWVTLSFLILIAWTLNDAELGRPVSKQIIVALWLVVLVVGLVFGTMQ